MNKFARLAVPSAAVFLAMAAVGTANAQSTDGYHSIQVIPVVVDSASYAQRFTIRHPAYVQCEIIEPVSGASATPDYGLEIRLMDQDGVTTIAGGNNVLGFGEVYLGDKTDRNEGANTRYSIQVESNGQNGGEERPYRLHCQSGSGHSLGDIVRYNTPGDTF